MCVLYPLFTLSLLQVPAHVRTLHIISRVVVYVLSSLSTHIFLACRSCQVSQVFCVPVPRSGLWLCGEALVTDGSQLPVKNRICAQAACGACAGWQQPVLSVLLELELNWPIRAQDSGNGPIRERRLAPACGSQALASGHQPCWCAGWWSSTNHRIIVHSAQSQHVVSTRLVLIIAHFNRHGRLKIFFALHVITHQRGLRRRHINRSPHSKVSLAGRGKNFLLVGLTSDHKMTDHQHRGLILRWNLECWCRVPRLSRKFNTIHFSCSNLIAVF